MQRQNRVQRSGSMESWRDERPVAVEGRAGGGPGGGGEGVDAGLGAQGVDKDDFGEEGRREGDGGVVGLGVEVADEGEGVLGGGERQEVGCGAGGVGKSADPG